MAIACRLLTLTVLAALLTCTAFGQAPYLVKDITAEQNVQSFTSSPQGFAHAFGKIIFAASTPEYGFEPWISDGTPEGTVMIRDIWPGKNSSQGATDLLTYGRRPTIFTVLNDIVLFSANDGVHGFELWKTDGTASGTKLVKDINPSGDGFGWTFGADPITVVNGVAYFAASDGVNGTELWRTDGTEAGTFMVKDVSGSARSSSYPYALTAFGNTLLFGASGGQGYELWKSDGTAAGTVLVRDIRVGTGSSNPGNMRVFGTAVLLSADDGLGPGLWRTDGTATGTVMLARIQVRNGGDFSQPLGAPLGNRVIFAATDAATGCELWATDGTTGGTVLVRDINPGATSSYPGSDPYDSDPPSFAVLNGSVFFGADDGVSGSELWKTDGTAAGTVQVKDIFPGQIGAEPVLLASTGTKIVFAADDDNLVQRPYVSDGTPAGTLVMPGYRPGEFCIFNGIAYFASGWSTGIVLGGRAPDPDRELWRTDGTVTGTYQMKDLAPWINGSGQPAFRGILGDRLILAGGSQYDANTGRYGSTAWSSDGTPAGTVALGPTISITSTAVLGSSVYFAADTDAKLWKTDGTAAGTVLVKDWGVSGAWDLTTLLGTLYFSRTDGLWKSDGTATGTVLATSITPLRRPVKQFGKLFFPAVSRVVNNTNVEGLFVSDGTSAGTLLLTEITARNLVVTPSAVFFDGMDAQYNYALWKTDGTVAGTVIVKELRTPTSTSPTVEPTNLTALGSRVLLTISSRGRNYSLSPDQIWRSDGTAAGTVLVRDFSTWCGSSLTSFTTVGAVAYFPACDATHGTELWRTDGTAAGTFMVRDIFPGIGSSSPQNLVSANNQLWFQANDGTYGEELWRTTGTASSTIRFSDVVEGSGASSPIPLGLAGTHLLFSAWQPLIGTELWAIDLSQIPSPCGDANGDTAVDATDVFYLINNVFGGGPAPVGKADVNKDGSLTAADLFRLIEFLFAGGAPLDC